MSATISQLLMNGYSVRETAKALRVSGNTVRKVRGTLVLPDCKCGKPAGHQGWCAHKLARSPKRQHFLAHVLPVHNKTFGWHRFKGVAKSEEHKRKISEALVGVPKKADAKTRALCKAKPLRVRRFYRAARIQIAHPSVRLDCAVDLDAIHNLVPAPYPDPCQMLMMKERWEQERKYAIWRRHQRRLKKVA